MVRPALRVYHPTVPEHSPRWPLGSVSWASRATLWRPLATLRLDPLCRSIMLAHWRRSTLGSIRPCLTIQGTV